MGRYICASNNEKTRTIPRVELGDAIQIEDGCGAGLGREEGKEGRVRVRILCHGAKERGNHCKQIQFIPCTGV